MSRLYRLFVVGFFLFYVVAVTAQPTFTISSLSVEKGEEIELLMTVDDFTSISDAALSLNWDTDFLDFIEITAINEQKVADLKFDNFDESQVPQGKLGMDWGTIGIPSINLLDGTWFVKLKYKTLQSGTTTVTFSDDPISINVVRDVPGVENPTFDQRDLKDGGFLVDGEIVINAPFSTMTPPAQVDSIGLNLVLDQDLYCIGEQFCYSLQVSNFNNIIEFQTPIVWNNSVLEYLRIQNLEIPEMKVQDFNTEGYLIMIMDVPTGDALENGFTLSDGTTLIDICFEVVGTQKEEDIIEIRETPLTGTQQNFSKYETPGSSNTLPLQLASTVQKMETVDCNEIVLLNTLCESGSEGEVVCVSIRANNFPNVGNFLYSHNWDSAIMDYVEIRSVNSELSAIDVDAGSGTAMVSWTASGTTGVTLNNNNTLYDICFKIKEGVTEGQSSPLTIDQSIAFFDDISGTSINDIRISDDCAVEVGAAPLPTVRLSVPDTSMVNEGSTICIEIFVDNFEKVDFLQFPLTWEAAVLRYTQKDNDQLDNISITEVANNEIVLEWQSPNDPVTLDDGTAIVSICFEAIGDAGVKETSESAIVFSGTVDDILIARNTTPLPFDPPQPGLVILEEVAPSAVSFSSQQIQNLKRESQICVPITVQNFESVIRAQTAFQWDSTILKFDYVTPGNLPGLQDYTRGDENTGNWNLFNESQLNLSWLASDDVVGETLPNDAVLAELCFTVAGKLGQCTRLTIAEALPFTQEIYNVDTDELQLIDEGKNICVTPFGIETEIVNQPDCGGTGSIEVKMAGGSGYIGNWNFFRNGVLRSTNENATLPDNTLKFDLIGSDIDSVCLSVLDRSNANLNDNKCWTIKVSDERVPIALAGNDLETGCVEPDNIAVELSGDFDFGDQDTAMTAVGVIGFYWTGLQGGVIDPFKINAQTATAISAGTYVLTVEIKDTGCKATDTLEVRQSSLPAISVDDADNVTCKAEKIKLVGQGQETGPNYLYEWRNEAGETLDPIATFEAEARQAGNYIFRVENTDNNCVNEQRVTVFEDKELPTAEAGRNMLKRCEDRFVVLDGTASDAGALIRYSWSTPNGSQIFNVEGWEPEVSQVGTYFLEVTDERNGCKSVDSMRVEADSELPVALATPTAFIGCGEAPTAVLDGSPTRGFTNANFLYTWKKEGNVLVEGRETAILDQTTVRDTGEYLLIIINTENDNCIADTAVVNVSVDDTKPASNVPTNITVGCSDDCIELPSNTDHSTSAFSYEWSTEDGFICEGENATTAQISTFGTYQLVLTNKDNNCADTTKVFIFPDAENNVGADAGAPKVLTCGEEMVLLNGGGSSKEPSHVHEWRFEGAVISDSLEIMVSQPGTYELIVRDTETGCEDNASVKVTEDKEIPKVDAGEDIPFSGCSFPTNPPISLVATNSDSGEEFDVSWTTADGLLMGDTSSLIIPIGSDGSYKLVITNKNTGCSASDDVVVSSSTFTPAAIIEPVDQIDCNISMLTLDALASEDGKITKIEWTTIGGNIVSGADGYTPVIDSAGTYILKLTASNGCEDKAEIVISANDAMVEAKVVMDNLRIFCNKPMMIDASESSTGENIVATWTTANGQIISGANTLLPEIQTGGTYLLTIEDTLSKCIATKEVVVESDGNLPAARAGDNQEVCGREAVLKATTPSDNVTGKWNAVSGGAIDTDTNTETNVEKLNPGENKFVWTLSSIDCIDYSSDTVSVNVATVPIATADNFTVTNDQPTVSLNLIQNDQTTTTNFDVNILTSLSAGSLTEVEEGIYEFSIPDNFLGRQEFEYEICSKACSEICANASVTLAVRPIALGAFEGNPNAITPNGDGLNDQLIFDQIFFEDFNDSELVIFNRWGDVVHKESPYNNDWEGKSADGTELPEGTYYYILRLHIGEGEIIRGEVTILK